MGLKETMKFIDENKKDYLNQMGKQELKVLRWSNGKEWGEIFCPMLNKSVMTYWKIGTPCYDTYTAPMVDSDNEIICYRFDQDEGGWAEDDTINLGTYEGEETCRFG